MKKFLMMLLCATLLWSCAEDAPENPVGKIVGSVSDYSVGDPISVVNVVLTPGNKSTVTGTDGTFSFENIAAGEYTITISKEGYKSTKKSVEVVTGKSTECHLLLERIPAIVTADTDVLNFGADKGVSALSFSIVNSSYEDLEWEAQWDCSWIKEVNPRSGVLRYGKTATIVVLIDRELLNGGENSTVIVIRSLNGNGSSEVKVYAEGEIKETPVLNMLEAKISGNSATFTGEVVQPGIPPYTERGFVYGTSSKPTTATGKKVPAAMDNKTQYSYSVSNLNKGQTYYVRAYATNKNGTAYSANQLNFEVTSSKTAVSTLAYSNLDIINGSVKLNGNISAAGNPPFSERGFCVSTYGEPNINDKIMVSGTNVGNYSYNMNYLESQKTYYVKAYAIQNNDVIYGSTISFSTQQNPVSVSISAATNIKSTSAVLNGNIEDSGSPSYDECGFCYSTSNNPTISNNRKRVDFRGEGKYTLKITDLDYRTTYYAKAYAIQNGDVVYSPKTISFTTNWEEASVSTLSYEDLNENSVVLKAQITNIGDPVWSEKGFCWSTSSNKPTVSMNKAIVSGYESKYSYTLKGLVPSSTYYVRAYLRQGDEVIYGNTINFTTVELPEVYTESVTDITEIGEWTISYNATFNGYIYSVGNPPYTKRGFVYSTSSNPQVDRYSDINVPVSGTGTGSFSKTITGLEAFKTYYVKAYVKTSTGYVYGEEVSFRTY